MRSDRQIIEDLLSICGVRVNGNNPWDLRVRDDRLYARLLHDKSLGLGESYVERWWDCDQLNEFVGRVLRAHLEERIRGNLKSLIPLVWAAVFNRQSRSKSFEVVERHYDLGNDLFVSFLDSYLQYSCAYFEGTTDLDQAQMNKMELIAKKLSLTTSDHLLDIGSGWGGLARYFAEKYGCRVTGVNLSKEQVLFSQEFCANLPIEIVRSDYRAIRGSYDKIVSVGMFEHVGRKNYRAFMEVVHDVLRDEGVFLLHTIGHNESLVGFDPWMERYIFPNAELPSIAQVSRALEGLFVVEDVHNLGPHYEPTLMAWHARFQRAWPSLGSRYDDRFKRMWEYYLLSCAGAFRARDLQVWQIVATKCGTKQPKCRS